MTCDDSDVYIVLKEFQDILGKYFTFLIDLKGFGMFSLNK